MKNLIPTRKTDAERDRGFTLIELMVVVLIIAILLAIAIPTFLGAQNKAKDRSAQSSARNTLTAAKTIFADNGKYTDATVVALTAVEPAFTFQDAASTGPKIVSIDSTVVTDFYAAAMSATGTCYFIKDVIASPGGTSFASSKTVACTGAAAKLGTGLTYSAAGW